jgi:hypothetical protein
MVIYILLIFPSLQSFCSNQNGHTGMLHQSDRYVCPDTQSCNSESFIYFLHLFLFLRAYTWFVHLSSQEKQKSCLPEDQVSNTMRRERRVVGMWMPVKEALETLLYEEQQEQHHIGIFQGVVWTLIWKLNKKSI